MKFYMPDGVFYLAVIVALVLGGLKLLSLIFWSWLQILFPLGVFVAILVIAGFINFFLCKRRRKL